MGDELFSDLFGSPESPEAEAADEATAVAVTPKPQTTTEDVVFDVETGPADSATLEEMFDFDSTKVKGFELVGRPFDPAGVKVGNLKDQTKIDAKIAEKKAEHEKAVADATAYQAVAREEAWLAFVERAPLSAVTGCVLAIGYARGGQVELDWQIDPGGLAAEHGLLTRLWTRFRCCLDASSRLIGHNIYGFDLPFLVRRSWLLGVEIPPEVFTFNGGRWQWHGLFVDTMTAWSCGVYGERIGLDRAAQFFGTDRKTGHGADFHRRFNGTPEERKAALDYLEQDLAATCQVACKMGIL